MEVKNLLTKLSMDSWIRETKINGSEKQNLKGYYNVYFEHEHMETQFIHICGLQLKWSLEESF